MCNRIGGATAGNELEDRAAEIRELCKLAGLPDLIEQFLASGKTVAQVRAELVQRAERSRAPTSWEKSIAIFNAKFAP